MKIVQVTYKNVFKQVRFRNFIYQQIGFVFFFHYIDLAMGQKSIKTFD